MKDTYVRDGVPLARLVHGDPSYTYRWRLWWIWQGIDMGWYAAENESEAGWRPRLQAVSLRELRAALVEAEGGQ